MNKLKILHLSTSNEQGGAFIAMQRLHVAMRKAGMDSNVLVLRKHGEYPNTVQVSKIKFIFISLITQLQKKWRQRWFGKTKDEYGLFSYAKYGEDVSHYEVFKQADVVYIHWVSGFLSLRSMNRILKTGKRVVIFLHDMWHITGGCHYSFECNKYETLCNCCQMFKRNKYKDCSYKQFKKKLRMFAKHGNVLFCTPSSWLTECTSKSPFAQNKKVIHITYPLDTSIFKPIDKQCARYALNLPIDKKFICFGAADGTDSPYKGWRYMEEALKIFKKNVNLDAEVLIFGSEYSQAIANKVPFPVHFTGRLYDYYSLALTYSAVDVYVTPTLADNLPQTCLEAMACGIPIVGFNVGGIPDMVEHAKTGYLAQYKDSSDLAAGIKYVLTHESYEHLSRNAVNKVHDLAEEVKIASLHKALLLELKSIFS
ncbi:MAG: glycosyltransferase [Prevotellaceae bacterium]|jgi:glycosyltransferase involved in cell wall biosynthesis|nr:glycosyltransferase [Prevotellaceae bacterium]